MLGQIHGGTAQGLGLALMEEIQVAGGRIRNPSFTDYLIPTILDMPPMRVDILEYPTLMRLTGCAASGSRPRFPRPRPSWPPSGRPLAGP